MFMSLYAAGTDAPVRYYYTRSNEKRLYTDVILSAEAAAKYFLSTIPIDYILILGGNQKDDPDEGIIIQSIDDGREFYDTYYRKLTAHNLFMYRLAQFKDGSAAIPEKINEILSPEEQEQITSFIRKFNDGQTDGSDTGSLLFRLTTDTVLYTQMKKELFEAFPDTAGQEAKYFQWIRNYLYMNLRESEKLRILPENENVKIHFIPVAADQSGQLPIDSLLDFAGKIAAINDDTINLYTAMDNDDMTTNFNMLGVLDILDTLHGSKIEVKQVCSSADTQIRIAGIIRDNSDAYGIAGLVNAAKAFLRYGKADLIVDCWERSQSKNEQVGKMVYAMRRIDTGLSLCNVGDLVKGISDLRELFSSGFDLSGSDYDSKLFILMSEGIKQDYGRLVTGESIDFADIVKWANAKGFYQQCLTLIEAKAPADFVSRGMLYYCADESDKEHVTEIFAEKRCKMKPSEYYLMDDMDHYFLKNYTYYQHPSNTVERQRENAKTLLSCVDNTDPEFITGYTVCDDRQALEDLLFSYLHIGRVRNETNHANDTVSASDDDKGISSRLTEITESIQYFIESYDKVYENVKDRKPAVVRISSNEVKQAARRMQESEKQNNS